MGAAPVTPTRSATVSAKERYPQHPKHHSNCAASASVRPQVPPSMKHRMPLSIALLGSSSNLLSGLAERFADSWKMRAVHHENSDEHVLLLTQNETLDLSGDSEELQTSEEISGDDCVSVSCA